VYLRYELFVPQGHAFRRARAPAGEDPARVPRQLDRRPL